MTTFPVILCGGSGTRLWPMSRGMYPKQFIPSLYAPQESLIGATFQRLTIEAGFEAPTLLCNNDYRFLLQDEVDRTGIAPREIILEHVARNTAPAIAVAAFSIAADNPDAIMVVMPSDHAVNDVAEFVRSVRRAASVAERGRFVLFGIKPDSPHTGYGYIRQGGEIAVDSASAYDVDAFVEKPDLATAEAYLDDGGYFWNSGIFVLPVSALIEELTMLAPDVAEHARASLERSHKDLTFRRLEAEAFAKCPNISIDYAVMEKTSKAAMLPLDVGWSDVGSWSSLWELADQDENGNAVRGEALLKDTRNSFIQSSQNSMIATIGVEDLVVVQTPDATLIANRSRAQDVGKIVSQLKDAGRREQQQHLRNYRPWGYFETLNLGDRFQVKLLHVKPGARLSMQRHHHRSEHWVVVSGTALVSRDDEQKLVCENESIYISATQWHRLENPGKVPLEVIEVQIGSYLGEDDIERSDDIYHREAHETK
ncbi:MAG: mannose-1-phosphate guanylyltransferase/mannose-6-phosphate isomerase [Hyphomicrobiales bacterium]|nr:mannose-1-phosphate guanylyltransferase/mannose-6-phosphate isomerase [Hyphomicrobiales bacterium]